MDGQFPNVSTRKEKRAHHVGISCKSQALSRPIDAKGRRVIHSIEQRVREGRGKDPLDQVMSSLATAAMAECNLLVAQVELMAARLPRALDFLQNVVNTSRMVRCIHHGHLLIHDLTFVIGRIFRRLRSEAMEKRP